MRVTTFYTNSHRTATWFAPMADWSWMSFSDWTDFTLERLRWKLDEDKRQPGTLQPWERNVIFSCLKEAKAKGEAFKFEGKRRTQVREILRPVEEEVVE